MNRTIISIEVQDNGDRGANSMVRGERNNQIMFENDLLVSNKTFLELSVLDKID